MGEIDPERWLRFVRFPAFTLDWERLDLDGEDLRRLELEILKDPTVSPVVRDTGGLRKIRFAGRKSAMGKSGAHRVCYVHCPEFGTVALVVVFGKNEKADLSAADRQAVASAIENSRRELEAAFRRTRRKGNGHEANN